MVSATIAVGLLTGGVCITDVPSLRDQVFDNGRKRLHRREPGAVAHPRPARSGGSSESRRRSARPPPVRSWARNVPSSRKPARRAVRRSGSSPTGLRSCTCTPMPSFASQLTDKGVADLANYIRTSWGNTASPNVTPAMVAKLRRAK